MVSATVQRTVLTRAYKRRSLMLSGNEVTDEVRALRVSGDGLGFGSFGIWQAATNLITNGGFATNATGHTAVGSTVSRIAKKTDGFQRADGAIGNMDTGQAWTQIAAAGNRVLATISGKRFVTAPSGGSGTSAYSGVDNAVAPMRMSAVLSFTEGTDGGAAVLIANANGLSAVANITEGSVHIVFTNTKCDVAYFAPGSDYHIVSTYTYAAPLVCDGVAPYSIGWSLGGSKLVVEMPDGTTQSYTNANFATYTGRYCTFEHFYQLGQCAPVFQRCAIDEVAKFGDACGNAITDNAATAEGEYHNFTATAAAYTVGAWVRGVSGTVRMAVRDNAGANAQTGTAVTLTTTPQRISLVTTALSASTWRAYVETDSQQAVTVQVDGLSAVLGTVDAPYIETDGGTAARAAARVRAPVAGLLNTTQGWVAVRARYGTLLANNNNGRFWTWADAGTDRLSLYTLTNNNVGFFRVGGGTGAQANISSTPAVGDFVTAIGKWTSALHGISLNGSAFTTTGTTAIPALTDPLMNIGSYFDGTLIINGAILWFACGLGTLSDADAALINSFGNIDPAPNRFPASARLTALWDGHSPWYLSAA